MELREKIKATNDRKGETLVVPEWDCTLYIAVMSGEQLHNWHRFCIENRDNFNSGTGFALVAQACCLDESGKPVFTPEDTEWLVTKSSDVLKRIFDVAMRVNGGTKEGVEATEKNSEPAQT